MSNRWIRILAVSFLMYTIAFIDRTNIAMALPSMQKSLGLSSAAVGFASGTFFFGYLLLQVPAGRLSSIWSAKRVVFYLLLGWAFVSMSTALVQSPLELTLNRFVLGIVEGGVLTSTLILIQHWFTRPERARANMVFLLSIPLASVIANPVSGVILHLFGWQMMFVAEGIPALLWAVLWMYAIDETPAQAKWLPAAERSRLVAELQKEAEQNPRVLGHWSKALVEPAVLLLTIMNFLALMGFYGLLLWLPTYLSGFHLPIAEVGLLSAIPYLAGALAMVVFAITSDRMRERKWHIIFTTMSAGVFMLLGVTLGSQSLLLTMVLLSLAMAGFMARFGAFWALPTELLPPSVAGVGIALINGVGNLGGFVGPFMVGVIKTATHSFLLGFVGLALTFVVAGIVGIPVRTREIGDLPTVTPDRALAK